MEDQIGALGLVLNALVLFNTRYMDAAVAQLRADGFDVRDEDVARLSPFVRHHINMRWAATPSSSLSCPAACARCATRTLPTTSEPRLGVVMAVAFLPAATALVAGPRTQPRGDPRSRLDLTLMGKV
jgi:hypothetical protein